MLNALDRGEQPVIHGDGSQSYDFVDVRDCARANVLAMKSEVSNKNYNVGTGIKTSIAEVAERLCAIHPNQIAPRFVPADRPFVRNRVGATELSEKDIGFKSEFDLDSGLRDFLEWRANHGKELPA